jgi:hypothetical protein
MTIEDCRIDEHGHRIVPVAEKHLIVAPYRIVGTVGTGTTLAFRAQKIEDHVRRGQENGPTGRDVVAIPSMNDVRFARNVERTVPTQLQSRHQPQFWETRSPDYIDAARKRLKEEAA